MNDDISPIRSLREQGKSWPDIFREILSQMHPDNRSYVHLTSELMRTCRLQPDVMNQLQRWNYWFKKTGYDDEELERVIEGKIALKE